MVANSSLKLDAGTNIKNRDVSAVDDSIVDFLCQNPRRVLIVDFLNVMIGGDFNAFNVRDIRDLCEVFKIQNPGAPLIIVTKKVARWPNIDADTAKEITKLNPNILILVCDTRDVKKHIAGSDHINPLAEADDNLIYLLETAMRAASFPNYPSCAPEILTKDKYRNQNHIDETIPRYEYTSFYLGNTTMHCIDPTSKMNWVFHIARATAPYRQKCYALYSRRCKECDKFNPICRECGFCLQCNMILLHGIRYGTSRNTCDVDRVDDKHSPSPDIQNPRNDLRDDS